MHKKTISLVCIMALILNMISVPFSFAETGEKQAKSQIQVTRKVSKKATKSGWVTDKNGKRFILKNGEPAKGLYILSGKPYFFNSKGYAAKKGWIYSYKGQKLYYSYGDGKLAVGRNIISKRAYMFNGKGQMIFGKQYIYGNPYYFGSSRNGVGPEKRWITFKDGSKLYTTGYGKLLTGFQDINGSRYYFNSKGYMQKGRLVIDGKLYSFYNNGKAVKKGWIYNAAKQKISYCYGYGKLARGREIISDRAYMFDKNGNMIFGKQYIYGKPYYFGSSRNGVGPEKRWITFKDGSKLYTTGYGKLAYGMQNIDGKVYVFNEKGYMIKGKTLIDGVPYYLGENGEGVIAGWIFTSDGHPLYYSEGNGKLATGYRKIGEKGYIFDKEGNLTSGKHRIDNVLYYVEDKEKGADKEAKWITLPDGNKLYTTGYGVIATGLTEIEGDKYLFNSEGKILTGRQIVNDVPYYFNKDGKGAARGFINNEAGKKLYYSEGKGKLLTGYLLENNKAYAFGTKGGMIFGKMILKGKPYYLDSNRDGTGPEAKWITMSDGRKLWSEGYGVLATGEYLINGTEYFFKGNGDLNGYKVKKDGKDYFYTYLDKPAAKGWIYDEEGKKRFYCTGNGLLAKGYKIIDEKAYYFRTSGDIGYGRYIINGKPYFFSAKRDGEDKTHRWITLYSGDKLYSLGLGKLAVGKVFINEVQYSFDEKGNRIKPKKGIDVSVFQGKINWKEVKKDGIEYAFIRTGGRFGATGEIYEDFNYYENMDGAIANGIDVGVYFFTQAVNTKEAIEEAKYTCKKLEGYKVTMPVIIDTEYLAGGRHSDISKTTRTKVVKAFCEEVKRQGYEPMVYGNLSWLEHNLYMNDLKEYKVWVAQYYTECNYKNPYSCWQYTSSGSVKGISGRVDMNLWYD